MSLCVELSLEGARVLVVGGGRLALHRSVQLQQEGASVCAVAPEFLPAFDRLHGIERRIAEYEAPFLDGCILAAAAATPEVNRRLAADAEARGILTLAAAPEQGARAHVLKSEREDGILLACSTGGAFPALSASLLDSMRKAASPFADRLPLLRRLRRLLLDRGDEESLILLAELPEKSKEELAVLLQSLEKIKKRRFFPENR